MRVTRGGDCRLEATPIHRFSIEDAMRSLHSESFSPGSCHLNEGSGVREIGWLCSFSGKAGHTVEDPHLSSFALLRICSWASPSDNRSCGRAVSSSSS